MKRIAIACLLLAACIQPSWSMPMNKDAPFAKAPTAFDKAMVSYNLHRWPEAAERFDKIVAQDPNDVRALYYGALTHHYLEQIKQAREMYNQVVTRFPSSEYAANAHEALKRIGRESVDAPHMGDVRPTAAPPAAVTDSSADSSGDDKSTPGQNSPGSTPSAGN